MKYLTLVVCLLCSLACKKDAGETVQVVSKMTVLDPELLPYDYTFSYTPWGGVETIGIQHRVTSYKYNDNKQLTKIIFPGDSWSNNSKVMEISYLNGVPVNGTMTSSTIDNTVQDYYSYLTEAGRVKEFLWKLLGESPGYRFRLSYTGNNLTKLEALNTDNTVNSTTTYKYDLTKKSPFLFSRHPWYLYKVYNNIMFYSENTIIEEKYEDPDYTDLIKYTYQYNAEGFPTRADITQQSTSHSIPGISTSMATKYEYIKINIHR